MAENLGNLAQSTLHTTVVAGDLSWVVDDPATGPAYPSPDFRVRVGTALTGELVLVTNVQASTPVAGQQTWTVVRGREGTTAQGWANGTVIQHVMSKIGMDNYLLGIGRWTVTPVKSANYTAVVGDFIRCTTAGGGFTVTLPTAVGCDGREIAISKTSADTNVLLVDTTGGETINGVATKSILFDGSSMTVRSDGANWKIV